MKRSIRPIIYTAVSSLMFIACKGNGKDAGGKDAPSNAPAVQNESVASAAIAFADPRTQELFDGYQQIRKALVASDAKEAAVAASELAEALSGAYPQIENVVGVIATADQLSAQREGFSALSAAVEPLLKETLTGGTVYKQFCPMAFEGEGGYWLSDTDAIRNPYYGDQMLKCGKVVTEISK